MSTRNLAGGVKPRVTALFGRFGMAVPGRAAIERLLEGEGPTVASPPLPDGAAAELRADHPRLAELTRRYRDHPAAVGSLWSENFTRRSIDLRHFRADNAYVWQRRRHACAAAYALTATYVETHDHLGFLDRLTEDGMFGATVHDVDGRPVSRDLLDSVLELTFLDDVVGLSDRPGATVLDVGAGYGRLAHRATATMEGVTWLCTDAVPVSTFLSEYYLGFRSLRSGHAGRSLRSGHAGRSLRSGHAGRSAKGHAGRSAKGAAVVPLDDVAATLGDAPPAVAVNVHSFEECPLETTEWWLDLLADHDVPALVLVANGDELVSRERSGARLAMKPAIEARGWTLSERRPKYAHSAAVQRLGLFPAHHYLFERR